MNRATAEIDLPVTDPQPAKETKLHSTLRHIFTLAPATTIRGGLLAPIRNLWDHYYPRIAFGEEYIIIAHSNLSFIITTLLAFAAMKAQCLPGSGFPFKTHPLPIMFSFTSLLMYALSSAAELVVSVQKHNNYQGDNHSSDDRVSPCAESLIDH